MKKALVLGATGGMGYSLVNELLDKKVEVIAFARNESKMKQLFGNREEIFCCSGDAFSVDNLIQASKDVDIIFHTISIPYPQWQDDHPTLMKNVLEAAKVNKTKVVVVDNIYAYGKGNGKKITETCPKQPHTKKGKIRLLIEKMAKEGMNDGIPVLIAHFPDFYGPNAENTILNFTLQSVVNNKKGMYVGNLKRKREFIFTPDGAKALVGLAMRDETFNQNWNIPGCGVVSGIEIIEMLRELTNYDKKVASIGKSSIAFLGLFNRNMREVVEMLYLTENPVILSGEKYESTIGPVPATSYREGLRQTLQFMGNK